MKKKIVVVGALAGGIALTGLAGSAYADGGASAPASRPQAGPGKPAPGKPVPGKPGGMVCVAKGDAATKQKLLKDLASVKDLAGIKGKLPSLPPGKPIFRMKGGKALPVGKGVVRVIGKKNGGKDGVRIIGKGGGGVTLPAPPPGKKGVIHVIGKGGPVTTLPPLPGHCMVVKTPR